MITEDYVSFEIAKLLKEKGFRGQGEHFYEDNKITNFINYWRKITPEQRYEAIEAPTLQMAMKWLREKCKLCIEPYRTACGYLYTISAIPYGTCIYNPTDGGDDEDSGQWTTYEKVVEEAIKYCLENIIL